MSQELADKEEDSRDGHRVSSSHRRVYDSALQIPQGNELVYVTS